MRNVICLTTFVFLGFLLGPGAAVAQSAASDEAVRPDGMVTQNLALTPAQKSAIYNAVLRQRVKPVRVELATRIGAPVPPAAELVDLPDQATANDPWASLLKYALVEDDIVVVDPVRMRVVDVIRQGGQP
jgi:hypothetical protein